MSVIFRRSRVLLIACFASWCWALPQNIPSGGDIPILRGSPELLRLTARVTQLPVYPKLLIEKKQSGLVEVEVTVSPDGKVSRVTEIQSFHRLATEAVQKAVREWAFYTERDMIAVGLLNHCNGCIRINRLGFAFRLEGGTARVEDLAHQELVRRKEPDPFVKLKRQ